MKNLVAVAPRIAATDSDDEGKHELDMTMNMWKNSNAIGFEDNVKKSPARDSIEYVHIYSCNDFLVLGKLKHTLTD